MRTLHVGLRVADLHRSLAFYRALGYEVVGSVAGTPLGQLTMLKLPGDQFVTIELVSDPPDDRVGTGSGLNHLVVQVQSVDGTGSALAARGIGADEPAAPDDPTGIRTRWITDPDGHRIELVQWPAGHLDGMTAADWPDEVRSAGT